MNYKKIHFIGVGGIGMSALARICLTRGVEVSGSDLFSNNLTDDLKKEGASIFSGHAASNVPSDVISLKKHKNNIFFAHDHGRGRQQPVGNTELD